MFIAGAAGHRAGLKLKIDGFETAQPAGVILSRASLGKHPSNHKPQYQTENQNDQRAKSTNQIESHHQHSRKFFECPEQRKNRACFERHARISNSVGYR